MSDLDSAAAARKSRARAQAAERAARVADKGLAAAREAVKHAKLKVKRAKKALKKAQQLLREAKRTAADAGKALSKASAKADKAESRIARAPKRKQKIADLPAPEVKAAKPEKPIEPRKRGRSPATVTSPKPPVRLQRVAPVRRRGRPRKVAEPPPDTAEPTLADDSSDSFSLSEVDLR